MIKFYFFSCFIFRWFYFIFFFPLNHFPTSPKVSFFSKHRGEFQKFQCKAKSKIRFKINSTLLFLIDTFISIDSNTLKLSPWRWHNCQLSNDISILVWELNQVLEMNEIWKSVFQIQRIEDLNLVWTIFIFFWYELYGNVIKVRPPIDCNLLDQARCFWCFKFQFGEGSFFWNSLMLIFYMEILFQLVSLTSMS